MDLFDQLRGQRKGVFKNDLWMGYSQLRVKKQDILKMVFRSQYGHNEFMVMSFGLVNAPETFMNIMHRLFGPNLNFIMVLIHQ